MRFPGAFYLTVENNAHKVYVSSETAPDSRKYIEFIGYSGDKEEIVAQLKKKGYIQGLSEQNCLDMLGFAVNKY